MSTSEVASGTLSGGMLPARRLRGEEDRGSSSGRDIFRFLIVEDVVKGSCLCSSGATAGERRLVEMDLRSAHGTGAEVILMRRQGLTKCGQGMQVAECLVNEDGGGRVGLPWTVALNLGEPRL